MDPKCFIPSLPESKLAENFDLASKLSVQLNIGSEKKLKEAIDKSGGQCDHGDDMVEEEGDGDDEDDRS
ncbi:hypothetical protein AHAS_Ahas16G0095800 [Arachis hypogaea]